MHVLYRGFHTGGIYGQIVHKQKYYSIYFHVSVYFVSHFLLLSFFSQENTGTETADKNTEKQGAVLSVIFQKNFFYHLYCINHS